LKTAGAELDKRFVIDASVVMTWCFEDETSPYAEAVLDGLESATAVVPSIWPLEIGNVLLVAERKNRLKPAAADRFIALLSELPIIAEPEPPERMLREFLYWRGNINSPLMMHPILILRLGGKFPLPPLMRDCARRPRKLMSGCIKGWRQKVIFEGGGRRPET
jgi:predicted nucleic acid-binding protein